MDSAEAEAEAEDEVEEESGSDAKGDAFAGWSAEDLKLIAKPKSLKAADAAIEVCSVVTHNFTKPCIFAFSEDQIAAANEQICRRSDRSSELSQTNLRLATMVRCCGHLCIA